jgi:hypothetical protein
MEQLHPAEIKGNKTLVKMSAEATVTSLQTYTI